MKSNKKAKKHIEVRKKS